MSTQLLLLLVVRVGMLAFCGLLRLLLLLLPFPLLLLLPLPLLLLLPLPLLLLLPLPLLLVPLAVLL
jgi:hypothetical protein